MAKITVSINGHPFDLACDEGQEGHLRELARFFDRHVEDLRNKFGQIGDSRLFIMAGLMIADQLSESLARVEEIEQQVASLKRTGDDIRGETSRIEESAIRDIENLADRIEGLADTLHS